jgi:hypothetical protein
MTKVDDGRRDIINWNLHSGDYHFSALLDPIRQLIEFSFSRLRYQFEHETRFDRPEIHFLPTTAFIVPHYSDKYP